MKINQWQHIQQHHSITALFILFVLMGSLTSHLAFFLTVNDPFQDDDVEVDSLTKNDGLNDIEKLEGRENSFSDPIQDSGLIDQDNRLVSNFAVGSQSGPGGGSVTIRDTFNWTGTIEMSTQNELSGGVPTTQTDSISITNSTSFNRQEGWFNISDVTATADWRLIENLDNTGRTPKDSDPDGDEFYEVAMSFNITEDWVNLTKVRIILDQNLLGNPEGELYIVNSTSGGDPDDTDILSESLTLLTTAVNWDTYTFTNPILLPNGTYFLVMNATVYDIDNFWKWYWQNDLSDDGSEDGIAYYKDFDHGTWTKWDPATIPLQIEVLPVYYNGSAYTNKTYQSPQELNFSYNTTEDDTELTSFVWFDWNNTNSHTFQTETSVSFNLEFIANYTYALNPISGSTNFLVNNGTLSFWNVSFSTAFLNTTYLVRNRTITIQGLSDDWNGSSIYHDKSFVYNETAIGGLNNSVLYTNQTTTMIINASAFSDAKDWDVSFIAPNYITSFNWQISNSNITTATTMDTLKANYTFITPNIGGFNFSIWIEAPDGTLVNSSVDNTFGTNDLYNWDINQSIHNVLLTDKANGTYQTYVFWENTTNNQVGFYTRNITVFIHTTLKVEAPDEVFENTWLNMTIQYNATHIETGVNNGNVTGLFGWNDTLETFNQPVAFGLYNLSIWIDGADHSPGDRTNITIYAEMPWYQNHSEIWNITVVSTTILSVIDVPANLILEYGQTHLLQVNYLYSGSFLPEANMTVDGDSKNYTEETDHYSYLLDTRNYNSSDSYFNLEIRLNRSGYLTQKLTFNLTVTAGPTTLHKAYTPAIPSIYYTESYSFTVFYNNTVDNEGIINATFSTSHSSAIDFWYFNSSGYYFFNISSSSLSLGSYQINITLNHSIYQENFILLTFNIVEMPTQPLDSYSISSNQTMVEETITVTIDEFLSYKSDNLGTIDNASILLNDSSVDLSFVSFSSNAPFSIVLDTLGIQYGKYNMTIILSIYGHESQAISFNVSLDGYETEISIEIEPGTNIKQGEDIIFIATLAYVSEGGAGAGVTQQVPLGSVYITFYIVLEYENGTTQIYEEIKQTDNSSYQATYTIDGIYTRDAIKLTNITIYSSPGLSGLPYTYSMSANELDAYTILPPAIDIFEVITNVLIIVVVVLVSASIAVTTIRVFRRRRRVRKQLILRHDTAIEQSFEDIKSIRLILARHQSGLQFYAEKTIAELQADTDALSGMSAAMSSFLEELSESMSSQSDTEQVHAKDKIEVMSREGLHMLIWHGNHSSLIIISEARLPDYFQNRLKTLGHELEGKFGNELKDFYSSDQIPSTVVKKMVRKYIPLHYFCAFVLNEGVLTLDSIKLDKKESKMLKSIKNIMFKIEGMNYFFSEQIISHLSEDYKRSEAINFLDRAIKINLLIEAEQDDLLRISRK